MSAETILDPTTGEVLTAAERDELVEDLAARLIEATRAAEKIPELRERLAALMDRERPASYDGWAVALEAAPRPPRQVIESAVREHAEALAPLGLAPEPQPPKPQPDKMPGVGSFTSKAARERLARVGLSPATFVHQPPERPDVVRVIPPEGG